MTPGDPHDRGESAGSQTRLRARAGVDVRDLPLEPLEAFLLSLLETPVTTDELAELAGIDRTRCAEGVRRLVDMGALALDEPPVVAFRASGSIPVGAKLRDRPLPREEPSNERGSVVPTFDEIDLRSAATRAQPGDRRRELPPDPPPRSGAADRGDRPSAHPTDRPEPRPPDRARTPPTASTDRARTAPNPNAAPKPGGFRPSEPPTAPKQRLHSGPAREASAADPPARDEHGVHRTFPSALSHPGAEPPDPPPRDRFARGVPAEERARIEATHASLPTIDHYRLLGLDRLADVRSVKRAYFRLAADYHPDRWFGHDLGDLAPKLEAIFARLTLAHDVLTGIETRGRYDGELDRRFHTPATGSSSPPRDRDDRERREALARRLRGAPVVPRSAPPPAPADAPLEGSPRTAQEAAAAILRNRREQPVSDPRRVQLDVYVGQAREAEAAGDVVAAANAWRLALAVDPTNAIASAAYDRTSRDAAIAMAPTHLVRGDERAAAGEWEAAAVAYVKACAGIPRDAALRQKAATALLRASGDLVRALELAREAVHLAPRSIDARLVLVEALLASNLRGSATEELETARKLDKRDPRIEPLARRLR